MLDRILKPELRANQEFQAALIRLFIWLFAASFIGLGSVSHYYQVSEAHYYWLFASYFVIFCGLFISIIYRAVWKARQYFSMLVDVSATSFAIFLTNEIISPFFLLYIWIFISQGTRYGKAHLKAASFLSVAAYGLLLTLMNGWSEYTFEAFFFMLSLLLLPLYQHSLLQKLRDAQAEAERLNQAKSDFLATMTHELRTPLSGITGMVNLLQDTQLKSNQKDYVESISKASNHLSTLVDDVLDMSKIESGRIELESAPIKIHDLLLDTCSCLMSQALAKKLELVCQVDERLPKIIQGDELRLRQVLFNLMGNAIKFTSKGEVLLHAKLMTADNHTDPHLYLEVIDTGIGIPKHALATLFERFTQVDASTTRRFGGTGLGTAIAQHLVHLMGGEIGVRSTLNKGSCFWVKLPLLGQDMALQKPQHSALQGLSTVIFEPNSNSRAVIASACKAVGIHYGIATTIESFQNTVVTADKQNALDFVIIADSPQGHDLSGMGAIARNLSQQNLPIVYLGYNLRQTLYDIPNNHLLMKPFIPEKLWIQMDKILSSNAHTAPNVLEPQNKYTAAEENEIHILVAEDNEINAKVLATILQNSGYHVSLARDGQEALELAEHNSYHIAFIDLHMPHLDGLGFIRAYRMNEKNSAPMPVIALSVTMTDEIKNKCLAAGMTGVASKPIMANELVQLIQHHLQQ